MAKRKRGSAGMMGHGNATFLMRIITRADPGSVPFYFCERNRGFTSITRVNKAPRRRVKHMRSTELVWDQSDAQDQLQELQEPMRVFSQLPVAFYTSSLMPAELPFHFLYPHHFVLS